MDSSIPLQIAETIQTASIKRNPSPSYDANPSTAASRKEPVQLKTETAKVPTSEGSFDRYAYDEEDGIDMSEDEEDIPESVLRPVPRRMSFGPLPDLRFEQSYLASIAGQSNWGIGWITVRDQIFMPLAQGMLWSLALHGWRFWNRDAQLSGRSVGAKVRRWWYRTNNWKIPSNIRSVGANEKLAKEMGDFYENQISASTGD